MGCRVLIVEDSENSRKLYTQYLQHIGYEVVSVGSAEDALKELDSGNYDCVLINQVLPSKTGLDLAKEFRKKNDRIGIVMITSGDRDELDRQCDGLSIWSVLTDPPVLTDIAENINAACEFSNISADQEAQIVQRLSDETRRMKALHRDILDETGFFKPIIENSST